MSGTVEMVRMGEVPMCGPVPASVPGEFVVYLGPDRVADSLDTGTAELLLTWLEWVEVEIQGFEDLMEELHRLRGAVMAACVAEGR